MARRTTQKTTAPPQKGEAEELHTTTVRLNGERYRSLRLYITTHEQRTGERVTHQKFFERAMDEYLSKNGGD